VQGLKADSFLRMPLAHWRDVYAIALFALVALVFVAVEYAFVVQVPVVAWLAFTGLMLLGWLATVQSRQVSAHAQEAAKTRDPPTSLPDAPPPAGESQQDLLAVHTVPAPAGASVILTAASHELRTPINAIVGFAELLRDSERLASGARQRAEYAEVVLENARHLQDIINDVLDANRLQAGTLSLHEQDCDFGEIVEVVVRGAQAEAEVRNVVLVAHVGTGIGLGADAGRLKKAVAALISNAIRHSPSDGIVNLRMQWRRDGAMVLCVTDAGAGLDPSQIERAFAPFSQLDEGTTRQHGGLGLGLFIARGIARLHGGDLQLASQQGVGTEARLIMPAHRLRVAPRQRPAKQRVA
jgi:signal transduction histidine kinase